MQTYYATHLPLPTRENGKELDVAVDAIARWIHRRFDVSLRPLAEGQASGKGANVSWSMLSGVAGGLFGIWVDQPDTTDSRWRWRTYVDVGVEEQHAWFRVRVHLYSNIEGLLTSPQVIAGRPGVVRQLVDELEINIDGKQLGMPHYVGIDAVAHYLALLAAQDRTLPVLTLSRDTNGDTFIDPENTADKLVGLAHVVVLDQHASQLVTEAIGKTLSCYLGAIRIYWPRMQVTDDPFYHRLYVGGALDFLGPAGLQRELFLTLGRLAGLTIDEPKLRRDLLLEIREAALESSVEKRALALARVSRKAQDKGTVSAEEFAAFADDYDDLDAKYATLELDSLELQREIDRLRKERDDARANLVEISRTYAQSARIRETSSSPDIVPRTVLQALEEAQRKASYSTFLAEATSSAAESNYADPSRVLEDLQLIEEVARDWALGELASGPHQAFKQRCSAYRDGIGQTASTKYRVDYQREWQGRTILLGPHIARGVGAVSSILRIYFYLDTDERRILIGHVGRKLRDDGNRN